MQCRAGTTGHLVGVPCPGQCIFSVCCEWCMFRGWWCCTRSRTPSVGMSGRPWRRLYGSRAPETSWCACVGGCGAASTGRGNVTGTRRVSPSWRRRSSSTVVWREAEVYFHGTLVFVWDHVPGWFWHFHTTICLIQLLCGLIFFS